MLSSSTIVDPLNSPPPSSSSKEAFVVQRPKRNRRACLRCKSKHLACQPNPQGHSRPCGPCLKHHVGHLCEEAVHRRSGRPPHVCPETLVEVEASPVEVEETTSLLLGGGGRGGGGGGGGEEVPVVEVEATSLGHTHRLRQQMAMLQRQQEAFLLQFAHHRPFLFGEQQPSVAFPFQPSFGTPESSFQQSHRPFLASASASTLFPFPPSTPPPPSTPSQGWQRVEPQPASMTAAPLYTAGSSAALPTLCPQPYPSGASMESEASSWAPLDRSSFHPLHRPMTTTTTTTSSTFLPPPHPSAFHSTLRSARSMDVFTRATAAAAHSLSSNSLPSLTSNSTVSAAASRWRSIEQLQEKREQQRLMQLQLERHSLDRHSLVVDCSDSLVWPGSGRTCVEVQDHSGSTRGKSPHG